jgi:hypothetical protein
MKRKYIAVLSLAIAGMFLSAALAFTQEGSAYFRECTGTVEIMPPGETGWTAAEPGQQLSGNTKISTGFKSTALVSLGNSTLLIRPLTRLTLDEIVNIQGDETVGINIQTGRIRAEVTAPAGGVTSFTVQSPMVTASVRGTSFDFDGINLTVDKGLVHIVGGDRTGTYVGVGQRSFSNPQTGKTTGAEATFREDMSFVISTAAEGPGPTVIIPESLMAPTPRKLSLGLEF